MAGGGGGVPAPPVGRPTPGLRRMSAYQTSQALAGLRAILDRLRRDAERFRRMPLSAVGLFHEGYSPFDTPGLDDLRLVARFLDVPAGHVHQIEGTRYAHRDTTHDGPFFAYLMPQEHMLARIMGLEVEHHLNSFRATFSQLHALTLRLPPAVRRMVPAEPSGWWATLFHLAIHFPRTFLDASRERWVNVTAPAPGVGPLSAALLRYPHESRVRETRFQFGEMQAPCDDIIPGVLWSRLNTDLFSATEAAVELLIERLEQPPPTAPNLSVVGEQFEGLHARFAALSEWERRSPRPTAGRPEPPVHLRWYPEFRVLKVANAFRMPPAHQWCEFPMELDFDRLLLAHHHADAEYLISRHLPAEFLTLAEQAGNALPPFTTDAPVLFSRLVQSGGVLTVPAAALNPDPVARWVRFVFYMHRANDPTGGAGVRFLDPPTPTPFPDLYGYATLPTGLFEASARAIEFANLLPNTPLRTTALPSVTPPVPSADAFVAAAVADRAHRDRGRELGGERERLWAEFTAALHPLRARWYAGWRAAAEAVAAGDSAGVVAALIPAVGVLAEVQSLTARWVADARRWLAEARTHEPAWGVLAPFDGGPFARWGDGLAWSGGPAHLPGRMMRQHVTNEDVARGVALLGVLAGGGGEGQLATLFASWDGVDCLRGLPAALAAALVWPADGYEFLPCELPATDNEREAARLVLGHARQSLGNDCLRPISDRITCPTDAPPDPPELPPSVPSQNTPPAPVGPAEVPPDELHYWDTPARQRVARLIRRCQSGIIFSVGAYSPSPPLDPAARLILSRERRGWSVRWLHDLCAQYLQGIDRYEHEASQTATGQLILNGIGRMDCGEDFAAFWSIADEVAGTRPVPQPPAQSWLNGLEPVRAVVRRLRSWCGEQLPERPPDPPPIRTGGQAEGGAPAPPPAGSSAGGPSALSPNVPRTMPPPPADGPEGGRWLWWQGQRYDVPAGRVYSLIAFFWNRETASFDELMGAGGAVWPDPVTPQTVTSACHRVQTSLPAGFPWRLSVDSASRTVAKVSVES